MVTFLWVSGHAVADLEALWSGAAAEAKRRGTYADLRCGKMEIASIKNVGAPNVGLEPTTLGLRVPCSTD